MRKLYRNSRTRPAANPAQGGLDGLVMDRANREPLYRQIARHLEDQIRGGQLTPGTRLPSTREVSRRLCVNLVTAVGAYRELMRQGLVQGQMGRGTFVVSSTGGGQQGRTIRPATRAVATGEGGSPMIESSPPLEELDQEAPWDGRGLPQGRAGIFFRPLGKHVIPLSSGLPSADFFPMAAFRRALETILVREGNAALQYQPLEGYGPLREQVASYLASPGAPVRTEEVLICSGGVTGVHIAARFLTRPGDVVLAESPTYCGCLSALESLGVKLVGVPVDREGMRVDLAERLVREHRPKAIYTIPTYNNPTGVCLSPDRRRGLLSLAQRHGIPIIEEDYANEVGYAGAPPDTLRSMDTGGRVIFIKSFAKLVFPSLRIAAMVAPLAMVRGILAVKEGIDPYSSGLSQRVLRELMAQPEFSRHVAGLAGKYRPRFEAMRRSLQELANRELAWVEPQGGVHLWGRLPGGVNSQELLGEAIDAGVAFTPGPCFIPDRGGGEFLRLSFGNVTPAQIRTGISRLARVVRRHLVRTRRRRAPELVSSSMLL